VQDPYSSGPSVAVPAGLAGELAVPPESSAVSRAAEPSRNRLAGSNRSGRRDGSSPLHGWVLTTRDQAMGLARRCRPSSRGGRWALGLPARHARIRP
jgi:hypothetical protein